MINPFIIRKYAAILTSALITVIAFFAGLVLFGFAYGLAFMGVGIVLGSFIAMQLLKNPFTDMLEGKGILACNWDSTGILRFFICQVQSPYIRAKFNGKELEDIFDRSAVMNMQPAVNVGEVAEYKNDGGLRIDISEEQFNRARHRALHYPLIMWNAQINSIITKDFISDTEKSIFAEHGILYLNQKIQELTTHVRDFGRYVVENLKPKQNWLTSSWVLIIIIIIFVVILIVLFAPAFLKTFQSAAGAVGSAGGAAGSIVPQ